MDVAHAPTEVTDCVFNYTLKLIADSAQQVRVKTLLYKVHTYLDITEFRIKEFGNRTS